MDIQVKRIYESASKNDGYRVLVDRIWPRGISKENAKLDQWMKEIAPSTDLRKWFGHIPERFDDFSRKYEKEIKQHPELVDELLKIANTKRLTLLYGAKDKTHNQAVVLKKILDAH